MLLINSLLLRQPLTGYSKVTWFNFSAVGLIVQVLGWQLINYAQVLLPTSLVVLTLLAQPFCSAVLAAVLLFGTFTILQAVG